MRQTPRARNTGPARMLCCGTLSGLGSRAVALLLLTACASEVPEINQAELERVDPEAAGLYRTVEAASWASAEAAWAADYPGAAAALESSQRAAGASAWDTWQSRYPAAANALLAWVKRTMMEATDPEAFRAAVAEVERLWEAASDAELDALETNDPAASIALLEWVHWPELEADHPGAVDALRAWWQWESTENAHTEEFQWFGWAVNHPAAAAAVEAALDANYFQAGAALGTGRESVSMAAWNALETNFPDAAVAAADVQESVSATAWAALEASHPAAAEAVSSRQPAGPESTPGILLPFLVYRFLPGVGFATIPAFIARKKGRSFWKWWIVSVLISLVLGLVSGLVGPLVFAIGISRSED